MDAYFSVLFNEALLAEAVHEEADAVSGDSHHFGQGFLAYFGDDCFRCAIFAGLGQQQKCTGQPFLTGVEKLINQVFL
jgi:hypothetical protein